MRRRARKRRARTEALEYARHRRRIFLSIPALFLRRPARELLPDLLLLPDSRIAASGHSRKKCFRSRRSETSLRGRSRVFTEKPPDGRSAGGHTGMDSRADSCGPVRSADRHMASWPEDIFRRNTPGPLRTLSAFLPLFRLQPRADGAHVAAFRQAVREQQHGPFSPEFIAQGFSQRI